MTEQLWYPRSGKLARRGRSDAVTPPGGESQMLVGITAQNGTSGDWREQDMPTIEALVGRMGVRRTFQPNIPSNITATFAGSDVGKRGSWQSVKSDPVATARGDYDAAIISYLATIPSDHKVMLTWMHEPDQSGRPYSAAQFKAGFIRFYQVAKSARPQTLIGPILMDWAFDPASGINPNNFNPGTDYCDFFGVDTYQTYLFPPAGSPKGWVYAPSARATTYMTFVEDVVGKPPAVGEMACGVYRGASGTGTDDFSRKVEWMTTMTEYMETHNATAVAWFNTNVNNDMSPLSMIQDDSASTAAWSQIVAAHQRWVV